MRIKVQIKSTIENPYGVFFKYPKEKPEKKRKIAIFDGSNITTLTTDRRRLSKKLPYWGYIIKEL